MSSVMVLHRGAREVTRQEIDDVPTPPNSATHYPIPFSRTLDLALENLQSAGFVPTRQRLALHGQTRLFATIDCASVIASGITLSVALRSSHDRSVPYGYVAGSRTFCCDNLSLSSDYSLLLKTKHTRFGEQRYVRGMASITKQLPQFIDQESAKIKRFKTVEITDTDAESLILRAYEKKYVSHKYLMKVLREWRNPSYEEFTEYGNSLWRMENAFTTILGEVAQRAPLRYSHACIGIQGLLSAKAPPPPLSVAAAA